MWDRTALINAAANALYAVAALLVLVLAWGIAARLPVFALREVRVGGDVARVTREQVERVVQRELKGDFLTVDLAAVGAAFRQLPWVRQVSVRRQWPARLEVTLEEHVPLARWGASALVNTHGEVFSGAFEGGLPVFIGPEGASREMTIQYRYFLRSLETIGQTAVQVQVSPRRAWQLTLASGTVLALGREQVEGRLARYVAAYDRTIGRLGRQVDYVDLRYANGFAVRIPELGRDKPGAKGGQRAGRRTG